MVRCERGTRAGTTDLRRAIGVVHRVQLLGGRLVERAGAFGQVLLIAAVLGSTTRADLYFIASIVPLTIGNVIGEAFAAAVLPRAAKADEPEATRLFSAGLWLAALALVGLTAVYLVAVAFFVPRATPAGTGSLLPWIAFAPVGVFFGLGAYCAAPLLHYERYVWPALRGAAATVVGLVLTAVVVALGGGVVWIGLAVSSGYGVALLLLVIEIVSIGRTSIFAPPGRWAIRAVRSLWPKLSASAGSGVIGGQVFVLIERVLTAPLGVGAVASISYARGVAYTPAILGQAISSGVYPSLLRAHAAGALEYVRERFVSGLRLTLFVTVVSGTYLALYSAEISTAFFGRDAVSPESLVAVQESLLAFSLAVLGWMLTIYGSRLFGALNLFRGLLLQELVALIIYLVIVLPFRNALGVPGVALAYGVGQVAGGVAGTMLIAGRLGLRPLAIARRAALPAVTRALAVVAALVIVKLGLGVLLDVPSLAVVIAGALTAVVVAVASLWPVDWPELDSMRAFLRRRRGPTPARQ